jgi:aryl-alcohol dehydrogenase-like predicted oxidoreductase
VENRYSMMARDYEELFPLLEELGVGLVAFSPMANGILTGAYGKGEQFDKKLDYRSTMPQYTDEAMEQNRNLFELLHKLAEEKSTTPAQISMAWMLCKKPWIVPIPGTRKIERMKENAGAADVKLNADDITKIDAALNTMPMSAVFGGTSIVKK